MSETAAEATNGSMQEEQQDDIPQFHLYVRASTIDNETQGACPMSQQGFMLCYLLAQEKNVDFKVWTVSQINPPQDFKEKNISKIFPFVEGIRGKDVHGQSIAGIMPDSTDKTEDFFDSVNFDCMQLKRPKNLKDHILGKIDGISTQFNALLKGTKKESAVTNILQKLDAHLAENGSTFLEGESLSYTDCFLLPRLQHIVVAGEYFKVYKIPPTMKNVWRYLRDAYDVHAFHETLPSDADLCKFHWERFKDDLRFDMKKRLGKMVDRFGVLENPDKKTLTVPPEIVEILDNKANGNGQQEEDEEEEEQQQQQQQQNDVDEQSLQQMKIDSKIPDKDEDQGLPDENQND